MTGADVDKARQKLGVTQNTLAWAVGVDESTIARWLSEPEKKVRANRLAACLVDAVLAMKDATAAKLGPKLHRADRSDGLSGVRLIMRVR